MCVRTPVPACVRRTQEKKVVSRKSVETERPDAGNLKGGPWARR